MSATTATPSSSPRKGALARRGNHPAQPTADPLAASQLLDTSSTGRLRGIAEGGRLIEQVGSDFYGDEIVYRDGREIHVTDLGTGTTTFVLLPGLLMTRNAFNPAIELLSQSSRCIAIDYARPDDPQHYTISHFAADVQAVLDDRDVSDVVMVGWSMGAMVMWEHLATSANTRTAKSVIIGQPPMDLRTAEWPLGTITSRDLDEVVTMFENGLHRAWLKDFTEGLFHVLPHQDMPSTLLRSALTVDPALGANLLRDIGVRDYRHTVSNLEIETLLLFGADDAVIRDGAGTWMLQHQSNAELVTLQRTGHSPMLEDPKSFAGHLLRFAGQPSLGESHSPTR